eukprot:scaffold239523_cov20-Prasinocladus_malaysianus.AAC.1
MVAETVVEWLCEQLTCGGVALIAARVVQVGPKLLSHSAGVEPGRAHEVGHLVGKVVHDGLPGQPGPALSPQPLALVFGQWHPGKRVLLHLLPGLHPLPASQSLARVHPSRPLRPEMK